MQATCKKFKIWIMFLFLIFATAGVTASATSLQVSAATKTGFQTVNGKTYYYNSKGVKHKGWLTLRGKKYYFDTSTGVQKKGWRTLNGKTYYFGANTGIMTVGWIKDKSDNRRYFTASGVMVKQWYTLKGNKYYFDPSTGIMKKGWLDLGEGRKYYFSKKTGIMYKNVLVKDNSKNITRYFNAWGRVATGLVKLEDGYRYFDPENDGAMVIGFKEINGKTYYFLSKTGLRVTGWITNKKTGAKYYFDPATSVMVTNKTIIISNKECTFDENGVRVSIKDVITGPKPTDSTGTKTIKNYLAGALQPVGQALYVWGGGWTDSTRKGVSPAWKEWYDSQNSSYDYSYYKDLSAATRAKGLDCSGFVGWAAYQVMHTESNIGSGYTVVSGDVGSYYKSKGWGSIVTQANLSASNWTLKPGDVGYNDGHTWIVIGQCSDKSVVIVHSTPQAGCQIAGTPTPSGNYVSEAIELAKKYMSKYTGFSKYNYHTSSGNYIRNGNYLRWNRSTLADPDGYMNMTADAILVDLFRQ